MTATILIDPELASLLTPLSEAEAGLLEHSIRTEGCRDPLVVWSEEQVLLDGHHRHAICTRLDIPVGRSRYKNVYSTFLFNALTRLSYLAM